MCCLQVKQRVFFYGGVIREAQFLVVPIGSLSLLKPSCIHFVKVVSGLNSYSSHSLKSLILLHWNITQIMCTVESHRIMSNKPVDNKSPSTLHSTFALLALCTSSCILFQTTITTTTTNWSINQTNKWIIYLFNSLIYYAIGVFQLNVAFWGTLGTKISNAR